VRMAGGGQASAGAIPPIMTRVGKEVVTLKGGDDFITQADKDETAALAMPNGSGEEVTVGAILPVARSRARVVPRQFGRSRSVAIFAQLEAIFSTLASNLAKLASMASCHLVRSRLAQAVQSLREKGGLGVGWEPLLA
jgi:hypothetical protein